MKRYKVVVALEGEYSYEDPGCPTTWRGSGVYDISVKVRQEAECLVCAEDEDQAVQFATEYDFDPDEYRLWDVFDLSVEYDGEAEPDDEAGVWDVVYDEIEEV